MPFNELHEKGQELCLRVCVCVAQEEEKKAHFYCLSLPLDGRFISITVTLVPQ